MIYIHGYGNLLGNLRYSHSYNIIWAWLRTFRFLKLDFLVQELYEKVFHNFQSLQHKSTGIHSWIDDFVSLKKTKEKRSLFK